MTREEQQLKDFSSGMKKLGNGSRNYIHKIAHALLLIEQTSVCKVFENNFLESKKKKNVVNTTKYINLIVPKKLIKDN